MTKSRYRYDGERAEAAFRRRYFGDATFDGLLFQVLWFGNVTPLRRYLLSTKPLSEDEREGLAWMLEQKLARRGPGRPRGRARSDFLDAAHRVCRAVRARREAERGAGRQRLPKGRLAELVIQAIKQDTARHSSRYKLKVDDADYILRRIRKR